MVINSYFIVLLILYSSSKDGMLIGISGHISISRIIKNGKIVEIYKNWMIWVILIYGLDSDSQAKNHGILDNRKSDGIITHDFFKQIIP